MAYGLTRRVDALQFYFEGQMQRILFFALSRSPWYTIAYRDNLNTPVEGRERAKNEHSRRGNCRHKGGALLGLR